MNPERLADPETVGRVETPPARKRRSWGMIASAFSCWFVGTHVVVLVPGVILFYLIQLCLEEGWREILLIRPGYLMMAMALASAASTTAWMAAGLAFFQGKTRRGLVWIAGAVASALITVILFAIL